MTPSGSRKPALLAGDCPAFEGVASASRTVPSTAATVSPCKIEIDFYNAGMVPRVAIDLARKRLRDGPVLALVGARQSGKTTLARTLSDLHFDLEQPADRLRLDLEWESIVAGRRLIVLDEVQEAPEVFGRLRNAIDEDRRRNGRFLLLGSVSPALMTQVSESLAGRLAIIELPPLILPELAGNRLQHMWLTGGFPDGGVLGTGSFPTWQRDYLSLMTQRDLPNWGLPAQPQVTSRLVRMLAAVHGQVWNASAVGQSLGLSYHTVNKYVDYLEGAFLVRRLAPFHANLHKRLVRSAKLCWRDSGLLHSLLGIEDHDGLLHHPAVGASWEGFVIEQALNWLAVSGHATQPFFFRASDGTEIDLVFRHRKALWAVEVKLTSSPSDEDFRKLDRAAELIGAGRRVLVSQTARSTIGRDRSSCTLPGLLGLLGE